jgi:hypothetical protein
MAMVGGPDEGLFHTLAAQIILEVLIEAAFEIDEEADFSP